MAGSERLLGCALAALLAGCSLITSASDHQDGAEVDGGPADAFVADAFVADGGEGEDMQVPEDLGPPDMTLPTDMSLDDCGVGDLNGGSLVASGLEAYDVEDFTLEVWFQPDAAALSGNRNLFGRWGRAGVTGSYALFLGDGRPSLALSCNGDDTGVYQAENALTEGVWVHLAATYQAVDQRVQIFVDGTRVVDTSAPGGCVPFDLGTAADLVLGYDDPNTSAGNPAQGLVDEARLSNVVRYTADFEPQRTLGVDPVGGQTLALYHFEDDALPAADSSSNENPMAAEGAAGLATACR
jgi:hypothetical protein